MTINLKRAYDPQESTDGYRVFIDRLWPRGLSHEDFHYDLWEKDIAPSTELREWFHADPENRWDEFSQRYCSELKSSNAFRLFRQQLQQHGVVTLLYGARDTVHNNAVVVKKMLQMK